MQSVAIFHGLSELRNGLLQASIESEVKALGHKMLNVDQTGLDNIHRIDPRRVRVAFAATCSSNPAKCELFIQQAKEIASQVPSLASEPQNVIPLLRKMRADLSLWKRSDLPVVIRLAITTIFERLGDPGLNIHDIARGVACSHDVLQNTFRDLMNCSVWDYVRHARIDRAKELLSLTDLSIGDIAWSVGSESHTNFSRGFKQAVGMSPTAFRTQYQHTVQLSVSQLTNRSY